MIYLDNAATSFPKAPGVPDAVARQLSEPGGNAGRASHGPALAAARLLFETRSETARFLGLQDERRLAFCKNATEALNLVLLGSVPYGGTVAVSSLEHNSVMRPLRYLERSRGVRALIFRCDAAGRPDPAELAAAIAARPDLLVVTAASNVTGAVLPFEEIITRCGTAGIRSCVDGAQIAGQLRVDLDALGADFFCFSGHKGLLGPTGTGGLCLGSEASLEPLIRGGTGSVSESEEQPGDLPDRFEAGTQNVSGLAGLLAAVRFLRDYGVDAVIARETALIERLELGLRPLPRLRLFGSKVGGRRTATLSFDVPCRDLGEIALELDRAGVACRAGLHCAPEAHKSLGTFDSGGTIRFSPGLFTTEAEIDEAVRIVEEILG